VWLLHWNEANGWDEMELVSGLCASDRAFGKAGTGEMELGQEIALVEGKEPLLPWGSSGL
jgi:hypothetical protein